MAQGMPVVRRGVTASLGWAAVIALALGFGMLSERSHLLVIGLLAAFGVGWLVLRRDLRTLVPLSLLALAWGSSILPGQSVAFLAKFAMMAAIGGTAALALSTRQARGHYPIPTGFAIASFAFLFVALLSTGWSIDASGTAQKGLSMMLVWAATVVAIPLWARSQEDIRDLLFGSGLVAAGVTFAGLLLGSAGIIAGYVDYGRFNGFLGDANSLGYWVAPILPALVLMAARSPAGWRKLLLIGSIVVLASGVALTGSRGSAIAAAAGVVAGFGAASLTGQGRQARRAIVVVILALIAAVIVFPALGVQTRTADAANEGFFQIGTGSNRAPAWQAAVRVTSQDPLIGHGFGTTPVIFPSEQSLTQTRQILGRTHNSYLEAAIDLGWPGMIALIALGLSGVVVAWRVARTPGPYQTMGAILLAAVVGGMVEGIFESGLLAAGGLLAFPFWMVVALAHSVRVQQRRSLIAPPVVAG